MSQRATTLEVADSGRDAFGESVLRWRGQITVALLALMSAVSIGLADESGSHLSGAGAALLYLPPSGWVVWQAVHGRRPTHAYPVLVGIGLLVAGLVAVLGVPALTGWGAFALVVLIVLPARPGLLLVGAIVAAQFPLADALGSPTEGLLAALAVSKAVALYALVLLLAAVGQLEQTRAQLAVEAVRNERRRLGTQLRQDIGGDLADLARRAERLGRGVEDQRETRVRLTDLVSRSRDSLARARGVIRSYGQPAPGDELETAVSLLGAAGIGARVERIGELPVGLDPAARRAVRDATAQLLREEPQAPYVIRLRQEPSGAIRVEVEPDQHGAEVSR